MPRYFIDSDDGELHVHDEEGQDLPDAVTAQRLATAMLPDMAREKITEGEGRVFLVRVRDEAGAILYRGTLSFAGEWAKPDRSS
ncbi:MULTISPECIES: DUF6894 family protein [Methylobacterium]|uniref:DUF6894 family protein n=1 Tax=Methylobacterium TaxID=407 RepID=UPI0010453010|nr:MULTISPECIES: hypothetical protein [Methylobacterium]MDR7039894.1 hypothetical protein [Methylobacterium sp. BE186]